MKKEDIAEKASKLAHIYSREVQLGFQNPGSYQGYCHGYIKGHEEGKAEANALWQEKIENLINNMLLSTGSTEYNLALNNLKQKLEQL